MRALGSDITIFPFELYVFHKTDYKVGGSEFKKKIRFFRVLLFGLSINLKLRENYIWNEMI